MRILLVFLIVLNLLYAFWEKITPHQVYNYATPLENNLKPLLLLRENNTLADPVVDEPVKTRVFKRKKKQFHVIRLVRSRIRRYCSN